MKPIVLSIAIGILSMILGAGILKLQGKEVKPQLFSFFILGVVLYLLLEITGAHKRFCATYK